ncbi:MAG: mannosyltransferase family protein [Chloroflexota bacterium]
MWNGAISSRVRGPLVAVLEAFVLSRVVVVAVTVVMALIRHMSPARMWSGWDGAWYLGIAAHGFHWSLHGKPAVAFFPLYPALVHLVSRSGLSPLVAAVTLSNLAFLAALLYVYALSRARWGETAARRALVLFALFPTAFFTFAPYSEALFLLAAAGSIYHARRDEAWMAGWWLAIAVLTRPTGIILIVPVLMSLRPPRLERWLQAVLPTLVGWSLYLLYLQSQHIPLNSLFQAQRAWHRAFSFPWTGFTASLRWLALHGAANLPWALENMLQLATTVAFLALTVVAWKQLSRDVRVYVAGFWLLALCSTAWLNAYYAPFSSMDRFVLALFPLAGWAATRLHDSAFHRVLVASGALLAVAIAVQLGGGWVG